ncbi:MAG: hypothetical protein HN597_03650 [Desulfobacula sp.]|jgi:hypothetical protein|uniref:hypothetical protein n=1 Tax=Desulfobacula sp. TaxID=2593537 RepID=UPI0039B96231|nr:hypothetical protein [Desulfobacula sp.]
MADETTIEPGQAQGQSAEGPAQEPTTPTGPASQEGQSVDTGTTQGAAEGHQDDATVFDPAEFEQLTKDLPPELKTQAQALQKSLQAGYTKKFQGISEQKKKIDAYDAFTADPVSQIEKMAKQLGYQLSRGEAQKQVNEGDWEPKSWDEVFKKAEESILSKLSPVLNEVQAIKKNSIESEFDKMDPSWRTYESNMMDVLKLHPTLAKDPATLYKMSVPPELLESRATQKALKKMEAKVKGGEVAGASTTKQQSTGLPDKALSFQDAIAAAKKKLATEGIRPN